MNFYELHFQEALQQFLIIFLIEFFINNLLLKNVNTSVVHRLRIAIK